jgi:hypothetical protein
MISKFIATLFCTLLLVVTAFSQSKNRVGFSALDSAGIRFSHAPGVYPVPIDLTFDLPAGSFMSYKIGWDPLTEPIRYTGPIRLSENALVQLEISDSLFRKYTYQGNYIIGRDITLPVICLKVTHEDFFPPTGIYEGKFIKGGENPVAVGKAFDKKPIRCFAEFLYNKRSVVATSCWLKTFGGFTLALPEKSLHLVADEKLGEEEFRYKFFPNKPYNEFEHLVLRTSGSDQNATRFQDMCMSSLAGDMGLDHMTYQPCVLFINDKYFGIINLREKINFDYLRYNHHAEKDSTYLIQGAGERSPEYQQLNTDLVRLHNDSNYAFLVDQRMDVENYMNYSILQLYIANTDSRGNIRFWKSKNLDNRWRWIFYDSDLGCQDRRQEKNFLADRISPSQTCWYNPTWTTHILRQLIADPELKDRFINQIGLMQATCLHNDTILSRIDLFSNWIQPEIPFHINRYPARRSSQARWTQSVNNLREFFDIRKEKFHEHMCVTFGLSPERIRLQISSNVGKLPLLSVNSSSLHIPSLDGLFYTGRSIRIEAKSFFPYQFMYWKEDGDTNSTRFVNLSVDQAYTAEFICAPFKKEIHDDFGIVAYGTEMKSKEDVHWIALFNLHGKNKKYSDFKLHLFGVDSAITIHEEGKWKDSTMLVITNHPKKWKKRFPNFKGTLVKIDFLNQFVQEGKWFLSFRDTLVDSLAFAIPDSLLLHEKRWSVIQTLAGLEYTTSDSLPLEFHGLRPLPPDATDEKGITITHYIAASIILVVAALLIFLFKFKTKK